MLAVTIENKERGIHRLCYLFLIFLTGCLVGWVYEEIFYWITEGMLRNRGILYGPWLPIYGIGALGIYAMKPKKKNPVLLFFLCAAVSGIVEYFSHISERAAEFILARRANLMTNCKVIVNAVRKGLRPYPDRLYAVDGTDCDQCIVRSRQSDYPNAVI